MMNDFVHTWHIIDGGAWLQVPRQEVLALNVPVSPSAARFDRESDTVFLPRQDGLSFIRLFSRELGEVLYTWKVQYEPAALPPFLALPLWTQEVDHAYQS